MGYSDKIIKDGLPANFVPYIFCPKCGSQMEIRDIIDDSRNDRKELYCTKCDFTKLYGS